MADTKMSALPSRTSIAATDELLNLAGGVNYRTPMSAIASYGGHAAGPASSTDNAIARFDSTTGKVLQNSVATLSDTGELAALKSVSVASGTLAASTPALNVSQTWNNAAGEFQAINVNITSTASSWGEILKAHVDGHPRLSVTEDGIMYLIGPNSAFNVGNWNDAFDNALGLNFWVQDGDMWVDDYSTGGTTLWQLTAATGLELGSGLALKWSSTTNAYTGTKDTTLTRAAAGTLNVGSRLRLPAAANASPADGDIWRADNTTSGLKVRVNGTTETISLGAGGGGSGDVTGPASSTDNAIARFDSTTGKVLQNSAATLDDAGALTVNDLNVGVNYTDDFQVNIRGGGLGWTACNVNIDKAAEDSTSPVLALRKSRSSGTVANGDVLGVFRFSGWFGSQWIPTALITAVVTEPTPGAGACGTRLSFNVSGNGTAVDNGTEAMRLEDGALTLLTCQAKLPASTTARASLNLPTGPAPTSPVDGDMWREDNTNSGLKIRINGVTKTITVS